MKSKPIVLTIEVTEAQADALLKIAQVVLDMFSTRAARGAVRVVRRAVLREYAKRPVVRS
jgi:hypothetical protein